jgi:DNA-binding LytR/AlgR family response regulator
MDTLEKIILTDNRDEETITLGLAGRSLLSNSCELIRFEEKKERHIWALPHEICFVKSADHYVKSLIQCARGKKWMSRHCTLKDLLTMLPQENFIRLNKFYLLNVNYFSTINEYEKILYLTDDFSIPIPHRISPYLRHMLKTTCT